MNSVEKTIAQTLSEHLDDATPPPRRPVPARKRYLTLAIPAVTAVTAMIVGFVGVNTVVRLADDQGPRDSATKASAAKVQQPEGRVVASGEDRGDAWTLRAYVAKSNGEMGNAAPMLCLRWSYGEESGEPGCFIGTDFAQDDTFFVVADRSLRAVAPTYGKVSKSASAVELRQSDGTIVPARIYETPAEWGFPFDFFVGFPPAAQDFTAVAVANGEEIATHQADALPRLNIQISGSGSGTVLGREGCTGCPNHDEVYIECPGDCWVDRESGAVISLEASATEGSVFVGWRGAGCDGVTDTCTVTLPNNENVEAIFEDSP